METKPPKPPKGVSRRGFMRTASVGGGVLSTGVIEKTMLAQTGPAGKQSGVDAVPVALQVNGKRLNLKLEPRVTLLDAFRQYAGITGAKRVCDRGTCGACTVIMDKKVVYSCTVLAIDAQGKDIQTIEGLAPEGKLHPVSAAFVEHDGQQCGYCTPGFVMAAKGFLDRHPNPTYEEVQHGLGGNLCRCGTYVGVRKAVLAAAKNMKGGSRNA